MTHDSNRPTQRFAKARRAVSKRCHRVWRTLRSCGPMGEKVSGEASEEQRALVLLEETRSADGQKEGARVWPETLQEDGDRQSPGVEPKTLPKGERGTDIDKDESDGSSPRTKQASVSETFKNLWLGVQALGLTEIMGLIVMVI